MFKKKRVHAFPTFSVESAPAWSSYRSCHDDSGLFFNLLFDQHSHASHSYRDSIHHILPISENRFRREFVETHLSLLDLRDEKAGKESTFDTRKMIR